VLKYVLRIGDLGPGPNASSIVVMTQAVKSSDQLLKKTNTEQLQGSPNVTADHIGVGVTDGTVTLSGQIRSYSEKLAAVDAALRSPASPASRTTSTCSATPESWPTQTLLAK
jgi:hypothetical protein